MTPTFKTSALALLAAMACSSLALAADPTPPPAPHNPASVIVNGIPKSIEPAISKSPEYSYLVRIQTVHKLSHKLTDAETEAILKFLSERHDKDWLFMKPMEFNAVKNEAFLALAMQDADHTPELADLAMDSYSDKTYDEMWRNYCVQFMGELYSRMDADRRERCVKLLWPAVEETSTCIPGAALIALTRAMSVDPKVVDKEALARTAYEALTSKDAIEINKTTALQTCAQLQYGRALEVARAIASDKTTPVPLRISAIAAVSQLGDASDKDMLSKLKARSDTRLVTAATAALKRLDGVKG